MNEELAKWANYFEYTASSAAAVLAIAFFTFQYRTNLWRGEPVKQSVALTTLAELATPLFFGLMCLAPRANHILAGVTVGIVGYVATGWHLWHYVPALCRDGASKGLTGLRILQHFWRAIWREESTGKLERIDHLQALATVITLTTWGIMLFCPDLTTKAYTSLWFIFSGLWEAWFLLRPSAEDRLAP